MIRSTAILTLLTSVALGGELSYNRDIRPILSDKCFLCHGPDEANNKADLRLDLPEAAYAPLKESSGNAIIPGKPDSSEAWLRILTDDPDEIMPPPEANLVLTAEEKELIRKWIEQGAVYEKHWAFSPLRSEIPVPEVNEADWPSETLDKFVLARLEREKIEPSAAAAPLRWLRRATFDLTGLPPTPEEIDRFQQQLNSNPRTAKADTVDRLLDSPAYGEHMAVAWLDAARYADSYGYQSDKLNTQWPYRDWVVSAFNSNLPYDQFLTWNLAGDLLENPTREQILATAFNRLHRLNNEGGAIFEEWRTENIADRVHTYGTAMLGLTLECSRCHDHKYDPITMRDYYSLFAFFNSIDESGMYDRSEKVPSPTLLLPDTLQAETLESAASAVTDAGITLGESIDAARPRFESWAASKPPLGIPDQSFGVTFDHSTDGKTWYTAEGDRKKAKPLEPTQIVDSPLRRILPGDQDRVGLRLDGDRGTVIRDVAPYDRWTPFTFTISYREPERSKARSVIAHHTRGTDAGYNGWDLINDQGHIESRLYRVWPGNAIGIRTNDPVPAEKWQLLSVTYDGSSRASGMKVYLDGEELPTHIVRNELVKMANVEVDHGGMLSIGQRFRDRGFTGAMIDEAIGHDRALTPLEIRDLHDGQALAKALEAGPDEALFEYYCSAHDSEVRAARARLTDTSQQFVIAEEAMNEIPVMRELESPLPAYILARGDYDAPKTEEMLVSRNTFESLPPSFPEDAPRDRLGLARWTIQPDHPLTSRVFVNRVWAGFFGTGLVPTAENFGLQGDLPSHPQLFDWLARDFVSNGWNVKRLCRQIALSATYSQASRMRPELIERDPQNQLLARGPAYRLSAEQIRDLALTASGLLDRTAGGPPVSPYQPGADLWREANSMSPAYKQSVGKALHRRSLYSIWKRTAPLPNMMAFDTGTREVCMVARSRTNTPLQALVLLNDVQFVEASRELASRIQGISPAEQIDAAFLALVGRAPDNTERETLLGLHQSELAYFRSNPDEATKLISHGESKADPNLNPPELAAATSVCLAVLNLDATIWKR